ncbi:DegQ family serine endoprotease [Pusillimonas noertemannii]|uniref:Probable periplasmic serine endoprotease DegP-like n=1 Tax=Pusillimonas noertemannii TaxID=305977 RepID=A0A2U1CSA8_9BURK|nr:DegQ family serine endoprotease [Pusillimonas noertemannii]NYT68076.1 DegQ family serine endoprotease [Pusillimonas noertemannii]PVY68753.1 serine protease Do [Pusillimonas noertemannii]
MRSACMSVYKFRQFLFLVTLGIVMACASMASMAQASVPVLSVPDFTEVVAKTEGSVVNIRTTETVPVRPSPFGPGGGSDPYEMFRWFFGPDFAPPGMQPSPRRNAPAPSQEEQERTVPRGVGSGFIISEDGYILTNNHVVEGANGIFVTMTDGKEYTAEIIGTDPRTDIALIKIDAKGLSPLPIGDSKQLKKGQWVLAIGSPFGLDSTVTSGIVSAINRETGDYLPFIQTDVAVNPGNSGGPLINLAGEVVGINSQIISQSGGFMGISLAIPIDEVMRVVEQLKDHGKVTRGRIGVQIGQVSSDVAKAIGLGDARGAMVSSVEPGGPAADAGVRSGDVITKFDDKEIKHWTDLPRIVGATKPGNRSEIEVWRKGKSHSLKVKVGEMPSSTDTVAATAPESKGTAADSLGLTVADVPATLRERAGIKGGVQVSQVQGPSAVAGIAPGDIILTINNEDIENAAQFAKVVKGLDKKRAAAVLIWRDGQTQWVPVTPAK